MATMNVSQHTDSSGRSSPGERSSQGANKILFVLSSEAFMPRQHAEYNAQSPWATGFHYGVVHGHPQHPQPQHYPTPAGTSQGQASQASQPTSEARPSSPASCARQQQQHWELMRSRPNGPVFQHAPAMWHAMPYAGPASEECPGGPCCAIEPPPRSYSCMSAPNPQGTQSASGTQSAQHAHNEGANNCSFPERHARTGINIYELASVWCALRSRFPDNPVVFASPRGGPVAIDSCSYMRLREDDRVQAQLRESGFDIPLMLGHTLPIAWVNPDEYAAAIAFGSHGALCDLPSHPDVAAVLLRIYENNKGTLAAFGRGVAAFMNMPASREQPRTHFLNGKRVACTPNAEEQQLAARLRENAPDTQVLATAYATGYGPAFFSALARETGETRAASSAEQPRSKPATRSTARTSSPQTAGRGAEASGEKQGLAAPAYERFYALPYSLEDELRSRGARVENTKPFEANVVSDARIVTAQNSASVERFVEAFARSFS